MKNVVSRGERHFVKTIGKAGKNFTFFCLGDVVRQVGFVDEGRGVSQRRQLNLQFPYRAFVIPLRWFHREKSPNFILKHLELVRFLAWFRKCRFVTTWMPLCCKISFKFDFGGLWLWQSGKDALKTRLSGKNIYKKERAHRSAPPKGLCLAQNSLCANIER